MKLRLIRNPICDELIEALAKEFATIVKEPLVKEPLPCQCPDEGLKPKLKLIKVDLQEKPWWEEEWD